MKHFWHIVEFSLKQPWNFLGTLWKLWSTLELPLQLLQNTLETSLKHWNTDKIIQTTLKNTQNILELTLKQSWNFIEALKKLLNFLWSSLKHSRSTHKTWSNRLWIFCKYPLNFCQILLIHPQNALPSSLQHSPNFHETTPSLKIT